jgi:hypothetical protein
MSAQTWQETLMSSTSQGALFNAFTTAKTVLPPGCLVSLPPNWWYVGRMVRVTVHIGVSNNTSAQTMNFAVNMGAVAAATSGNFNLTTTAHTTIPAMLTCLMTCMTVGTSTNAALKCVWMAEGTMFANQASVADNGAGAGWAMSAAIPANGTGFDSTAAQTLDFFAGISTNTTSVGLQVNQYIVESLN